MGNSVRACAGLVLAGVVVLGLAACGGQEASGEGDRKAGGEPPQDAFHAPADIAGTTTLSVGGELTPVDESDEARVLAPGVDLRVSEVGRLDVLPTDVFEDLTSAAALD